MKAHVSFGALLFLLATFCASSQSPKPPTPKTKAPPIPIINCSDPDYLLGCKSLKDLVKAHDPDILGILGHGRAYACFRPKEDVFFLVFYFNPERDLDKWVTSDDSPSMKSSNLAAKTQYKSGLLDHGTDLEIFKGQWVKETKQDEPRFNGQYKEDGDQGYIGINGSELLLHRSYTSESKREMSYQLSVQLSTGRFIERYSCPDCKPEEIYGKCLAFNEGVAIN